MYSGRLRCKFEGTDVEQMNFFYTAEKWDKQYRQRESEEDMNQYHYEVGDIVKLKKQHPCGSSEWEILRVGADFRLKCTGLWTSDHDCKKACREKIPEDCARRGRNRHAFCAFFKSCGKTCYSRCS